MQVVVHVDPAVVRFAQQVRGGARLRIGDEDVEDGLRPVHRLHCQPRAVWQPLDAGQVLVRVNAEIDPGGRGILERDDACADFRIRGTGFGMSLFDQLRQLRLEVHVVHFADAGFIGLQVGDRGRVRGPQEATVGPVQQFFPVDPGNRAVQGSIGTVRGQAPFFARFDLVRVDVVVTDECKPSSVR